jgi:hypothetical protein
MQAGELRPDLGDTLAIVTHLRLDQFLPSLLQAIGQIIQRGGSLLDRKATPGAIVIGSMRGFYGNTDIDTVATGNPGPGLPAGGIDGIYILVLRRFNPLAIDKMIVTFQFC